MKGTIKFIDLFAGIGGIRCGLELAAHEAGYKTECVFTSEIKKHAIKVLKQNHPNELINGDITQYVCCGKRDKRCRKIEKSHAHSETSAPFWLLQEFQIFLLLLLFGNRLLDVRRFFHLLNFRLLRFLPGLKLRFEIVPFLLSDAFRTFHLPGYFRRASVLDGIKIVEAFLRLPVKPHAPIKRAFTLPEKNPSGQNLPSRCRSSSFRCGSF